MSDDYYVFIIDTDSYSGNFERAMCGYLTGIQNESTSRTDKYVEAYKKEMNIAEPYEHNEHIIFMPGGYGESPVEAFPTPGVFREHNGDKYPAYQSVGIFMDRKPTDEEIKILKERANKFQLLDDSDETIKVLGFRLIQRITTEVEIVI